MTGHHTNAANIVSRDACCLTGRLLACLNSDLLLRFKESPGQLKVRSCTEQNVERINYCNVEIVVSPSYCSRTDPALQRLRRGHPDFQDLR